MLLALTRPLSPRIAECELTYIAREPIDFARAAAEHHDYEQQLAALGATVRRLPAEPALPDGVFVEDTAVVLDEIAVITRPGAESRRAETASVAAELAAHRLTTTIAAPGTLDGGDVLVAGRQLFVGQSSRSNAEGTAQLRRALAPHGYSMTAVPVAGCLHLKSAVTCVAPQTLLVNPEWVPVEVFAGYRLLPVDPAEPMAANALALGGAILHASQHRRTRDRLEAEGFPVVPVSLGELAKAEGTITCCSLVFETR
jgi:dimethylargininase